MIKSKSAPYFWNGMNQLGRRLWYAIALLCHVALVLFVAMVVPSWNQTFIVDAKLNDWLPSFYVAAGVNIVIYALLLGFEPHRQRTRLEAVADAFTIIALLSLISIFPFEFADATLAGLVKLGLWLSVLGILAALVVDAKRIVSGDTPAAQTKKKNTDPSQAGIR